MSEGTVKFGKFELLRQIARGGMAQIFLATEHGPNDVRRQLVVKRILPEMIRSDESITMFTDEARLVTRLAHPNIAPIYGFGEIDGVHYLSMEYVDGVTVGRLIRKLEPERVPIEITLRIAADMCAGLHYAHELRDESGLPLGVIHRDISPQNIMVSRAGSTKIIDFGVARAATQVHVTQSRKLKGKLPYMAPELLNNEAPDRRVDVFAAGVVLFEMVTATRLYPRKSEAAMINAILYDEPQIVLPQGTPSQVQTIIARALEKNRDKRYETAEQMQLDLEELIAEMSSRVSHYVVSRYINSWLEENPPPKGVAAANVISSLSPASEQMLCYASDDSLDTEISDDVPTETATGPWVRPVTPTPTPTSTLTPGSDIPNGKGYNAAIWVATFVGVVGLAALITAFLLIITHANERTESIIIGVAQPHASTLIPQVDSGTSSLAPINTSTEPNTHDSGEAKSQVVRTAAPQAVDVDAGSTQETPVDVVSDKTLVADAGVQQKGQKSEPRRSGTLFLDTEPWSKVRIAGRSFGSTPVINVKIPAGRHTVSFHDADGNQHSRQIVIKQGKATKVFFRLASQNL